IAIASKAPEPEISSVVPQIVVFRIFHNLHPIARSKKIKHRDREQSAGTRNLKRSSANCSIPDLP
ncbi:MAG: hypothetical protein MUE44_33190, partial [Oscillatoriaceae cyanobacterium Prado104]|nr:hypothetical protein [Oscillatoriaceae cyanobacterium Prado104]